MLGAGLAIGGAGLLGSAFGAWGAKKQGDTAAETTKKQVREMRAAREAAARQGERGAGLIADYGSHAQDIMHGYGGAALGNIAYGGQQAAGHLTDAQRMAQAGLHGGYTDAIGTYGEGVQAAREGFGSALDAYGSGMQQAQAELGGGMDRAAAGMRADYAPVTALSGYAHQAAGMADQFRGQSRMQQLLADPGGYMAQDPGYAFRQQQGEQAIERARSARGGRASGAAMKELAQFNQGLASQEFGAAAQRAQAADASTLSALGQQAGIQAGLGQMGYGAQQGMASQLGALGAQRAAGMSGLAGQQAGGMADIYGRQAGMEMAGGAGMAGLEQGRGTAMAGLASQYGSNMANLASGTAGQLAGTRMGIGTNMANMAFGIGTGMANTLSGSSARQSQLTASGLPAMAGAVPYAGGVAGAIGQGIANIGQTAGTAMMLGGMYGGGGGASQMAASGYGTGGGVGIPGVNIP